MGLKGNWKDLIDGESLVEVDPINKIAKAVISSEEKIENHEKSLTDNTRDIAKNTQDISTNTTQISQNQINISSNTKEINNTKSIVDKNSKRIANLEYGVPSENFVIDNSVAYIKDVPVNSAPYAEIVKIGGMTYKDGDTLKSAPVTEVESVGANIWDEEWYNASLNETTGVFTEAPTADVSSKNYISVIPNTQHYISVSCRVAFYDKNKAFISAFATNIGVFVTPSNCYFMKFQTLLRKYGAVYKNDIIIAKGDTAKPYTPYTKNTLAIPEAVRPKNGIPNGAYDSIEWHEDGTKKSHQRLGVVDLGTLDWKRFSSGNGFYALLKDAVDMCYGGGGVCSKYDVRYSNDNKSLYTTKVTSEVGCVVVDSDYTDATAFKNAMSGVMLYYELAEPIITDISDILSDDNLIGVEGGGTLTFENEHKYTVPSRVVYQIEV